MTSDHQVAVPLLECWFQRRVLVHRSQVAVLYLVSRVWIFANVLTTQNVVCVTFKWNIGVKFNSSEQVKVTRLITYKYQFSSDLYFGVIISSSEFMVSKDPVVWNQINVSFAVRHYLYPIKYPHIALKVWSVPLIRKPLEGWDSRQVYFWASAEASDRLGGTDLVQ